MLTIALCVLLACAPAASDGPIPFSHALFDSILQARVDAAGRVDYAGLQAERARLDAYVDSLGRVSPRSAPRRFATRDHALAYWINAYNAFVLRGVIDAYPVSSVSDIGGLEGFFGAQTHLAGGEKLTLDGIEHGIIRPEYRDPRIHFAVNCGAASCPPLGPRAYTGDDLDAQLEAALRAFARNPQHVRLGADGRLHLSKILEWYGQDFADWFPADREPAPESPSVVDYLLPYLPGDAAEKVRGSPDLDIVFDEYDWSLNGQGAAP